VPPLPTSPAPRRRSRLKRLGILVSGWLFVVLGVLGLVLPILQGILFLFIGFSLLSLESPWAKRLMERFAARHPAYAAKLENARLRAARVARRLYRRR
jgi:uncharacterized membrane protein YbaN (DUF454 family)